MHVSVVLGSYLVRSRLFLQKSVYNEIVIGIVSFLPFQKLLSIVWVFIGETYLTVLMYLNLL